MGAVLYFADIKSLTCGPWFRGNTETDGPIIMSDAALDLGFDPDALREKYLLERDKRIREEGNEQYQEVKGEFAHYVEDPYIEEEIVREPLFDEVEIAVIGGGFGGLLAGARLLSLIHI